MKVVQDAEGPPSIRPTFGCNYTGLEAMVESSVDGDGVSEELTMSDGRRNDREYSFQPSVKPVLTFTEVITRFYSFGSNVASSKVETFHCGVPELRVHIFKDFHSWA